MPPMSSLPQNPPTQDSSRHAPPTSYGGNLPPMYRSDSYPPQGMMQNYPPSYQGYLPPGPPPSHIPNDLHPPPPPQQRKPGRAQNGDPPSSSSSSGPPKKKARTSQPANSPPPTSSSTKSKFDAALPPNPPAVLIREKKQKACANCRRAKLKCIVGEDQSDCVRCLARKEKCTFYPRNQDEDWQQTMAHDVYAAMSHLSDLSSAVHHLIFHLSNQGIVLPFSTARGTALDRYEAPERDLPAMQGWDADRNKDLKGSGGPRKRGMRDETEEEDKGRSFDDSASFPPQSSYSAAAGPLQQGPPLNAAWLTEEPAIPSNGPGAGPASASSQPTPGPSVGNIFTPPDLTAGHPLDRTRSISDTFPISSPNFGSFSNQPHPPHSHSPQSHPTQPHPPELVLSDTRQGSRSSIRPETTYPGSLVPAGCILGSNDPRDDVITEGMVAPADAVVLVNHCHERLSPFLFGFRLEFGHFPYLPGGPTLITPLILAVHCLLASERIPSLYHYHSILVDAVKTLIVDSPAGSWRTMGNVLEDVAEGTLILGEDELDPEVGIGPEEIVAAALLSLWISNQNQARDFARRSFQYARGWIKVLSGPAPRATIAETMGMVTQERVTTEQERARVWLLCYLAEGIATVMDPPPPEPIRDPYEYWFLLVPYAPEQTPSTTGKHDIVLTTHARALHAYQSFLSKFKLVTDQPHPSPSAISELHRLTTVIDLQIDEARQLVHDIVSEDWISVKALDLFSLFVKATVPSKMLELPVFSGRQRATYVSRVVDAGLGMLEACASWQPASTIADLPHMYLLMITGMANRVTSIVMDAARQPTPTGCSVTAREVMRILEDLARTLAAGGLPPGHNIWVCVNSCTRLAEQMKGLCA